MEMRISLQVKEKWALWLRCLRVPACPQQVQDAADHSWESNKGKPAELNIPIQTLGWAYHSSPRQRQKSKDEVMDLLNYCAKDKCKPAFEYRITP